MLEGVHTALVTPFTESGEVDFRALRTLIEEQILAGVDGIVPVGTTGESPTLSFAEHQEVISTSIETARGRIKIIAGTGANSTSEAIELTQFAHNAGADATLQVTPYYNKPNDAGLQAHFSAIADIGLPVVLYNVPGRSAKELSIPLITKLAEHPNIIAVKEAGGSVDRVSCILDNCDLEILSGDDVLTLPMIVVGAIGVISVASNIIPAEVSDLVHTALAGQFGQASEIHRNYHRLFAGMFMDTNPVPVKTAAAMMGHIQPTFRLPLTGMSDDNNTALEQLLTDYQLL